MRLSINTIKLTKMEDKLEYKKIIETLLSLMVSLKMQMTVM